MSASPSRALHTIAAEFLALLETYEDDVALLLLRWPDDAQFQRVWRHMEQLRLFSAAVPQARVQASSLLIAHAELVQLLCRSHSAYEVGVGRDIAETRASHRECLAALRFRLQWVLKGARAPVS